MATKETKEKEEDKDGAPKDELKEKVPDGPKLAQSRSEKKRNREQQRRNQLNEGLDRLTEVIFIVDPDLKAAARARASNNNRSSVPDTQLLSRVELIDTAVATLHRVHQQNEMLRRNLSVSMGHPGMGGAPALYQSLLNQHLSRETAAAASLGAMAANPPPDTPGNNQGSLKEKDADEGDTARCDNVKEEGEPSTKKLKKTQKK